MAYHHYLNLVITAQSIERCLSRQSVYADINGAAIAEGVVGEAGRSRKVKCQLQLRANLNHYRTEILCSAYQILQYKVVLYEYRLSFTVRQGFVYTRNHISTVQCTAAYRAISGNKAASAGCTVADNNVANFIVAALAVEYFLSGQDIKVYINSTSVANLIIGKARRVFKVKCQFQLRAYFYYLCSGVHAAICIFYRQFHGIHHRSSSHIWREYNLRPAAPTYVT